MVGVGVMAGVGEDSRGVGVTGRVTVIAGVAVVVGDGNTESGVPVSLLKGLSGVSDPLQLTNRANMTNRTGTVNRLIVFLFQRERAQ
jgi:hypothetical protein